ncbi:MAG: hypothetical protein PHV32_15160 [Eubacteriales bacterium]|nr:hypothetical protein [Eubacteriales bacterium]
MTIEDRADFIKTKMHDHYLDNGDYTHYSVAYDYSLSISSYVSMINNNDVLIAVCVFDDGNYHASVMYDYTLIAGGVRVILMDPFKGLLNISWTGGDFSYYFSTYELITLDEYVLSYY